MNLQMLTSYVKGQEKRIDCIAKELANLRAKLERRKTVAPKRAVQQPKQYICPKCKGRVHYSEVTKVYACLFDLSCKWRGKRPAVR